MSWYLLKVVSRQELTIKHNMKKLGYNVYCPVMYRDRRGHARGWTTPMWPGYMSVWLETGEDNFADVLRVPGVSRFCTFGRGEDRRYGVIENSVIDFWKSMEDEKGVHGNHNLEYQPGDAIETTDDSAYRHYRGIVLKSEKGRLSVLFELADGVHRERQIEKQYVRPADA